jgi:molybdopterin-guanine dinucleotide biosynthesis protein A
MEELGDSDIAVPVEGESEKQFHHPLAAVYRLSVLAEVERLLAQDRLRLLDLFDAVPTRRVPVETLREVDPELATLLNLNRREDYVAALASEGLRPLDEMREP